MCMNCKHSNNQIITNTRWYFSPKLYEDIKECTNCFQILEVKPHEHVKIEDNWEYDQGSHRDVIKCKVCRMVLEERPHQKGFQDAGDALKNYLTSIDTLEEQEDYTRKLAI